MLDVILIIVSALCMIAGLAGCVLPFLPGPPIAYLGLVFLHFTDKVHYTIYGEMPTGKKEIGNRHWIITSLPLISIRKVLPFRQEKW